MGQKLAQVESDGFRFELEGATAVFFDPEQRQTVLVMCLPEGEKPSESDKPQA